MSQIQVDSIQSESGGPVQVSFGATIPSGQTLVVSGDLSVAGNLTATTFVGDGSGITNLPLVGNPGSFARVWVRI